MRSSVDGKNDLSLQIYVISPSNFYEACIILQISIQLSNLLLGVCNVLHNIAIDSIDHSLPKTTFKIIYTNMVNMSDLI